MLYHQIQIINWPPHFILSLVQKLIIIEYLVYRLFMYIEKYCTTITDFYLQVSDESIYIKLKMIYK